MKAWTRPTLGRIMCWVLACLALGILGTMPAGAQQRSLKVRMVSPAWSNLLEPGGKGLYPDLLKMVYGPAGYEVSFWIAPWKRCKALVSQGKADAMPAAYLTPPGKGWIYPRWPMDQDRVMAVFAPDASQPWQGPASLMGRRVAWPRGYNFHDYLKFRVLWQEVDNPEQGWLMIKNQRVDFYLDTQAGLKGFLAAHPRELTGIKVVQVFAINTYLRFADRPGSRRLIAVYDQAMTRLAGSDRLRELYRRWGQRPPELNPRPVGAGDGRP